jgi:hypothetical protein
LASIAAAFVLMTARSLSGWAHEWLEGTTRVAISIRRTNDVFFMGVILNPFKVVFFSDSNVAPDDQFGWIGRKSVNLSCLTASFALSAANSVHATPTPCQP